MITKLCLYCNKEFKTYPSLIRVNYCSMSCERKARFKDKTKHPNWKGGNGIKICIFCKKEFQVLHSKISIGKFCSHKCYWKYLKGRKLSKEIKQKMKGRIAWNKGLNKKTDKRIDYLRPTKFKKGQVSFNKGRKIPKASISKIGGKNPMWKGGISKEPYSFDFTKELKELIKKRDNYTCQLCEKTEEEERKNDNQKRGLTIHHQDYNKQNCNPDNLITLCRRCNSKVNKNRSYWTNYFNEK